MDHYLFTVKSVTHAQHMARILERSGIYVTIRRAGTAVTKTGCGYAVQVPARKFRQAVETLRAAGQSPVRVFLVSGGEQKEVAL